MEKIIINIYKIIPLFFSLFIRLSISNEVSHNIRNLLFNSEITITLLGSGNQYILNNYTIRVEDLLYSFDYIPDKILINDVEINYTGYMVYDLEKEENNITMIFYDLLPTCQAMFSNLRNITYIDLSKFDSSHVTETSCMFYSCESLISINFGTFNTESVTDMHRMFFGCISLTSLNLSSFKTSNVLDMYGLFASCESLLSLDLRNFDTSSVNTMSVMFLSCSSLKVLDLSNFNTSSVVNFHGIFKLCSSLISLNINNFSTQSANNMNQMFNGCSSLISLNLFKFEMVYVGYIYNMFDNSNLNNMILCLNNQPNIISALNTYNINYKINCSDVCFTQDKAKIISEKNICISKCYEDDIYVYEYENLCYERCPNGTHISSDEHSCEIDIIEDINSLTTDIITTIISYKTDKMTDTNIFETNKITDNDIDEINIISNKISLETDINTDNNIDENDALTNYLDQDNNGINENISYDIEYIKNISEINTNKLFKGEYNLDNLTITEKDQIIEKIKDDIENGNLNLTSLISGDKKDLILKENTTLYQITTTDNQNNTQYEDISKIQLGECEDILKSIYKIDDNLPLIIFKVDHFVPGIEIPVIGYDIFHPTNKSKLDLKYCKDSIVNFQIPVSLEENNLFKYDPNSEYYTDECSSYTTEDGTDILLNDRHDEYNNNNYSLCEQNCSFVEYEKDTKKAICDCNIKSNNLIISEIMNEENILAKYNFTYQSSFSNIKTMKCVYQVFTKEGLAKNIGNYIFLIIILIFLVIGALFYKFGYHLIEVKIKEIVENEEYKVHINNTKYNKESEKDKNNHKNKHKDNQKNKNRDNKKDKNKGKITIYSKHYKNDKKRKSEKNKTNRKRKTKKFSILDSKNMDNFNNKSNSIIDLKNNKTALKEKNNINNSCNKSIENEIKEYYNDYELNSFGYEKALKYDKRTKIQYYMSLIKTKHPIIFSFVPLDDYNSSLIKASLFLILFSIIYIINALFFNESTIHKIYKDGGIYNFVFFIPKIFLSFAISHIIYTIIKYFTLTERNLHKIKNVFKSFDKIESIKRCIVIKYLCYFVIGFVCLWFFWFYLSSFCAVFKNSQVYLIKNTIISFVITLIYPFFINIIPSLLRINSLNARNRAFLYKLSKIFQYI